MQLDVACLENAENTDNFPNIAHIFINVKKFIQSPKLHANSELFIVTKEKKHTSY